MKRLRPTRGCNVKNKQTNKRPVRMLVWKIGHNNRSAENGEFGHLDGENNSLQT